MKKIQNIIMKLAAFLMPKDQGEWSRAMEAEITQIASEQEQLKFALGCLKVSTLYAAQTRKGLSFIGRGLVAIGLAAGSLYGIIFAIPLFPTPILTTIFTALCFFYAGAAAMTALSLKGLRLYSSLGLVAAFISGVILKITKFETLDISNIYLQAISFEWAVANIILLVTAIYLSLINAKDDVIL